MSQCVFCNLPEAAKVEENDLAFAVRDIIPVSQGHTLIIPKRHVADYFDLTDDEIVAINAIARNQRAVLMGEDTTICAFNFGVNCGEDAGQSVFHVHMHLIPRRKGDTKGLNVGIRSVITEKADYRS